MSRKAVQQVVMATAALALAGCHQFTVLAPSGAVAAHQRNLLVATFILMLIVVIPLFAAIIWVAIRYRHSNHRAAYAPEWEHSAKLELLIWGGPLAIVVAIGAMTWVGTHTLDPFRQVAPSDYTVAGAAQHAVKPLKVDVVALDWQWLFLYPQYGIAAVNQVAAPVNVPVDFRITASDVMNSFYIPALAGQIYAMPGMRTKLSAVINKPGDYRGISANFSGAGFAFMHFHFLGKSESGFKQWVAKARSHGGTLSRADYLKLTQPTIDAPVSYYAHYAPGLFRAVVNRCVKPGKLCKSQIRAIDRHGGTPLDKPPDATAAGDRTQAMLTPSTAIPAHAK